MALRLQPFSVGTLEDRVLVHPTELEMNRGPKLRSYLEARRAGNKVLLETPFEIERIRTLAFKAAGLL